eukprot:14092883-Heterocapsa_arctica.AAC.1
MAAQHTRCSCAGRGTRPSSQICWSTSVSTEPPCGLPARARGVTLLRGGEGALQGRCSAWGDAAAPPLM